MLRPAGHEPKLNFYHYFLMASPRQIKDSFKADNLYLHLSELIKTFPAREAAGINNDYLVGKLFAVLASHQNDPRLQLLVGVLQEHLLARTKALEHYHRILTRFPTFYPAYTYYCTLQFERVAELNALPKLTTKEKSELKNLYMSVKWVLEEMKHAREQQNDSPTRYVKKAEKRRVAQANDFYGKAIEGLNQLNALNWREIGISKNAVSPVRLFAKQKEKEQSRAYKPKPF